MPLQFEDESPQTTIKILGKNCQVPEGESVLRGLQRLGAIRAYTEFCWNGDCVNCKIDYLTPKGEKRNGLACRVMSEKGLEVTRIYSVFIKFP